MAPVVALVMAVAKAVPAAERLVGQITAAYAAWKTEKNLADEQAKNARDRVDIAAAADQLRGTLCGACPFAADHGGRQYGGAEAAPAVPPRGPGGA